MAATRLRTLLHLVCSKHKCLRFRQDFLALARHHGTIGFAGIPGVGVLAGNSPLGHRNPVSDEIIGQRHKDQAELQHSDPDGLLVGL